MKKYVFDPYDPLFKTLFIKEKTRILQIKNILQVEHVGSTAIEGLGGKGIIDIAILADKKDLITVSKDLQNLGYEFRPQFSEEDRLYFVIDLSDPKREKRRYHIHLTCRESPIFTDLIRFRDYLISHPEEKERYAAIKKKATENQLEGEAYRAIKDPYIKKILEKLRQK
jgi:GrpB-like predicted nucleotidyltransferase (UPF0157 family)